MKGLPEVLYWHSDHGAVIAAIEGVFHNNGMYNLHGHGLWMRHLTLLTQSS